MILGDPLLSKKNHNFNPPFRITTLDPPLGLPRFKNTILHCTTQYYIVLHSTTLYYTVLHCTTQYYIVLHSTTLYYTVLHCPTQYYIVLHSTTLYYTVLHCITQYDKNLNLPIENPDTVCYYNF